MARVSSDYQPGQTYVAYDMGVNLVIRTLVKRIEEDEYYCDTWGNYSGKTPYGWYWRVLNLLTGTMGVMIDNEFNDWELM